eukprot:5972157-Amphidinium_carterae.1
MTHTLLIDECNVWLDGRLVLHHSLSLATWKHESRSGAESNEAETFACGGVNCRDRHVRHLKQGTPICEHVCEHESCGQTDTPAH